MYTVIWSRLALNQLADIWLAADDRNAVTVASDRLDQAMATDPADTGESRDGTRRIAFDRPLGVLFEVDPVARRVDVVSVRFVGPR